MWNAILCCKTIPLLADLVCRPCRLHGVAHQHHAQGRGIESKHGLSVIVPNGADRDIVHRAIYDELCHGKVIDASRREYQGIIGNLTEQGAQAVFLGCTEITLLIGLEDSPLPVFDTSRIYGEAAVAFAVT